MMSTFLEPARSGLDQLRKPFVNHESPRDAAIAHQARMVAILLATIVVAYHYSLSTLIKTLSFDTPLAYLGLVPLIALASGRAAGSADEPRTTDPRPPARLHRRPPPAGGFARCQHAVAVAALRDVLGVARRPVGPSSVRRRCHHDPVRHADALEAAAPGRVSAAGVAAPVHRAADEPAPTLHRCDPRRCPGCVARDTGRPPGTGRRRHDVPDRARSQGISRQRGVGVLGGERPRGVRLARARRSSRWSRGR